MCSLQLLGAQAIPIGYPLLPRVKHEKGHYNNKVFYVF